MDAKRRGTTKDSDGRHVRITRVLGPLWLLGVLTGCEEAPPPVTATAMSGPGGGQAWEISCRGGRSRCFEKAGDVCPQGYNVVDAETLTRGSVVQRTRYGANVYNAHGSEVLVECTDTVGDELARQQTHDDEVAAVIQRHPKFPEIGATRAEAKATCEHQRGQWIDRGDKVGCQVRDAKLFVCELADATTIACTHWKLGADVTDERDSIAALHGKPTSSGTDARGFRTYTWEGPDKTITLGGYAAGVVVTESAATDSPPMP